MKIICREKKKQLELLDTCNDHGNYTQHSCWVSFSLSYKPSLYPQRVVSLKAIREVCCVMVSCTNTGPVSRDSSEYNLSRSLYFEKFSRFSLLHWAFSRHPITFMISARNATVSTNSKQVGLRHSRGVNMLYFSGLSFRDTQRVWVFRVWGLSFRGLSFRDTPYTEADKIWTKWKMFPRDKSYLYPKCRSKSLSFWNYL